MAKNKQVNRRSKRRTPRIPTAAAKPVPVFLMPKLAPAPPPVLFVPVVIASCVVTTTTVVAAAVAPLTVDGPTGIGGDSVVATDAGGLGSGELLLSTMDTPASVALSDDGGCGLGDALGIDPGAGEVFDGSLSGWPRTPDAAAGV
jgi:hypothetical protein